MWTTHVEGWIPSRFTETSFKDVKMLLNLSLYKPEMVWRNFFFNPKGKDRRRLFLVFNLHCGWIKRQKTSLLLRESVPWAAGSKRGKICSEWRNSDEPQKRKGCVLGHRENSLSSWEERPGDSFGGSLSPATVEARRRELVRIFFF